jgi:hypothetical protein
MVSHLAVTVTLALGLASISATVTHASDEPDELVPGVKVIVRYLGFVNVVGKAPKGVPFDLPDVPANDPTIEGATLRVFDTGGAGGDNTYVLPASGWTAITTGGFKYRRQSLSEPCKIILIRTNIIRIRCAQRVGPDYTPPFAGNVGVILTVGTSSKRYCASFGGTELHNNGISVKRVGAPAPGVCPSSPSGAFLDAP